MAGLAICGTGGMGREAAAWVADAFVGEEVVGFLDPDPARRGTEVGGLPVLGDLDWLRERTGLEAVVAIGAPAARSRAVAELDALGVPLRTVVHPSALVGPRTVVSEGAITCPGVVLTCDVTVGRAAIVNYGAMVGHDVVVGAGAFVAPGACLAGNVTIGPRGYIGIGASVIQGVNIGEDAVVGAGAAVVRDVAAGTTVIGVPARPR